MRLSIQLNTEHCPALVVGAAEPAVGCVATLLEAGAVVTVVAPELGAALAAEAAAGRIEWHARPFEPDDLAHARLVFAASECPDANRQVREAAVARGCLCSNAFTGEGDFSLAGVEPAASAPEPECGEQPPVWLVGAGPGDPDLLTVAGQRVLRQAEVVLYDRLVAPELLALAPPAAERIFVGKQRANHRYQQPELNALMIERARSGRRVVRLKGGDPFIFGRGGEEVIALAEAGLQFRVIPGITAGSACPTYADIPLTHRDHAHSCQFITAHGKDGASQHDWAALVRSRHTLVVYMGLVALEGLCPTLIEHGLPPETPAALIERGTTPEQRVLTGTVASVAALAQTHALQSPALLVIGEVVRVREQLQALRSRAPTIEASPCAPTPVSH